MSSNNSQNARNLWERVVEEISLLAEANLDGKAQALDLPFGSGLELVDRLIHLNPDWAISHLLENLPAEVSGLVLARELDDLNHQQRNELAIAATNVLGQADELNQVGFRAHPPRKARPRLRN